MAKNLRIYLLMFLVLINLYCRKSFREKLIMGNIYNPNFIEYSQDDVLQVYDLLKNMFDSIEKKDLQHISNYISLEKGIFIDLKAFKTKQEFINEINNPDSFINAIYLDTKKLIEKTNDPQQISLYQLIENSNTIKAEFYILTPVDIEVKLILVDLPKESYRFNNPYFVKVHDKWYIYRLF